MNTNNNNTNTIFFTIEKNFNQVNFSAKDYNFLVSEAEKKPGTNGKCLWYYNFTIDNLNLTMPKLAELEWVSWNAGGNGEKVWEYLLLKANNTLYSGFINQAKEKNNIFYCSLKPVPVREEEEFNF